MSYQFKAYNFDARDRYKNDETLQVFGYVKMLNCLLRTISPLYPLEDNRESLVLWCSQARVGWEKLPKMCQSVTWLPEYS